MCSDERNGNRYDEAIHLSKVVEKGGVVSQANSNGNASIWVASQNGHVEVEQYLQSDECMRKWNGFDGESSPLC